MISLSSTRSYPAAWHPVRRVALLLVTGRATLLLVIFEKAFDFGNLISIALSLLGFAAGVGVLAFLPIAFAMPLHNALGDPFQLLALFLELLVGAAPLLGSVRRQYAAVDSEVILAD